MRLVTTEVRGPKNSIRFDRLSRFYDTRTLKDWREILCGKTLTIAGAGGLGGAIVPLLARYPLGALRIIDRDAVDETNLGHQLMFTPEDAAAGIPKAAAAARYARKNNPTIKVVEVFADLRAKNAEKLLGGSDLVIDGLDNFGTRFLINDWCLKNKVPYVYGGIVESEGVAKAILPGKSGCLRCLMPAPPPPGSTRTCDMYGVHLPLVALAGAIITDLTISILLGDFASETEGGKIEKFCELIGFSISGGETGIKRFAGSGAKNSACRACAGHYDFLDGAFEEPGASVCGRSAVAISLDIEFDPAKVKRSLESDFDLTANEYLVRATSRSGGVTYTVFSHGRVMMEGSEDESLLRKFVSRYLGD